ncbi:hypothetical protein L3Q82_015459 [Scortum barcoo]|uniref:Uncharacterized protein n=1 Tax=Scortum barcoo TaxID=214431 RepID=A0ACB8VNV3_9TELE|nr:hypothetical protein L3Q82_015459 [Scortum barcoo]
MIKWFLDGLLPHISTATKKSFVAYEDARLTELIRCAKNAERQITAEKKKKSDNREKQAHAAHLLMIKTFTNLAENERQARNRRGAGFNRRGRNHGKGGRGRQGRGHSWLFSRSLLQLRDVSGPRVVPPTEILCGGGPCGNPCLPSHFFPHYAKLTHGSDHVSKGGMLAMISTHWFTKGFSAYAQKYCQACMVCAKATHNAGRPVRVTQQAAHPPPTRPFEHLMMDFVEVTPSEGKKQCVVIVDMWSKWVEAFPATKQTASVVAKALLQEIIPRWGIPTKLSSDNGTHFVNQAIQEVGAYLGIDLKNHCAYHPASGGAVERENGTLKAKLAKTCEDTGLPWTKALPIVLMYMRMRRRARTGLSPYEVLLAAPPPHIGAEHPREPPPSTAVCENAMLTYCINLSRTLSSIRQQVAAALHPPASKPLHSLHPGDFVVVKDFRRKHWQAKHWHGPFQILLTTHTAVKVAERATWIHASHYKRVPAPAESPST